MIQLLPIRAEFRLHGSLCHLSFWGSTQVWPIWPFVWNAGKCTPPMCSAASKTYFLWCRLWFYDCLRSGFIRPEGL